MFSFFKNAILYFFLVLVIFLLHFAVQTFLPFPLNLINVEFLFLAWFIVYHNNLDFLWVAMLLAFFIDLFSVTPFGFAAAGILVSLLVVRRLYLVVFTNFTWYSMLILGMVSIFCYRVVFTVMLSIFQLLSKNYVAIKLPPPSDFIFEILINGLAFLIAYILSRTLGGKKLKYARDYGYR